MKKILILLILVLACGWNSYGQVIELPLSDVPFTPIKKCVDPKLSEGIKKIIDQHPKWKKLAKKRKLSFGVVDISNPSAPRFAEVNGDEMLYAASLPKIAILLAVVDAIDKGELEYTEELNDMMTRMINVSSNTCATQLIDLVGYDKIAEVLKGNNLYDEEDLGGLWVGKRYGKGGKKNPDPIKGLSHAASATQVCRFYYLLAYGKLINPERSAQILGYLKDPHLHHKFVSVLDQRSPSADLYRKSGTWRTFHSDSVMVIGEQWRSYILVALVNDKNGEVIIRELIKEIDTLLNPSEGI